jgi:hypothetical protein
VTWHFAYEKNRNVFIASPKKYKPQFGGFCAYAASYGQAADIDPNAWTIIDNKLYLK